MAGIGINELIALGIFMLMVIIFVILARRDINRKKKELENELRNKKKNN